MNRVFTKFAPLILLAAAVLFAYFGVTGIRERRDYIPTTAVITDITRIDRAGGTQDEHRVTVAYDVGQNHYESELGEYSSSMRVGKEIAVKYNPERPGEVATASYTAVVMSFVMAVIALAGCAVVTWKRLGGRQ